MNATLEHQQPRVSVRILRPVAAVLRRQGFDPAAALEQARIEQRVYDDPEARVPVEMAVAFVVAASRDSGIAELGLEAGKLYHESQFELLEYLAASHATMSDTLDCLVRYQRLIMDAGGFCLEPMDDHTLIRLELPIDTVDRAAEIVFAEALIAAVSLAGLRIVGRSPVLGASSEVWFAYPAPESADACEAFFGGRVRFGAPAHGILVSNEAMATPTRRHNASVQSMLEEKLDELAVGVSNGASVGDRVATLIAQELAGGDPSMPKVAARLQMSPSTLRRRLAEEGLTHRELLRAARERKALLSLKIQALSLEEVAYLVGYDDVTVFHRAFKRWTGLSPHAFRTQALQ